MSSIEQQNIETDLNNETGGQLETDQQALDNEAQERADSVADGGGDMQADVAGEANESQPPLEGTSDPQERLDSVADQPNRTEVIDATRVAHLNEAREHFDGAPNAKEQFNEAAAQVPPDVKGHFSDAAGDDVIIFIPEPGWRNS